MKKEKIKDLGLMRSSISKASLLQGQLDELEITIEKLWKSNKICILNNLKQDVKRVMKVWENNSITKNEVLVQILHDTTVLSEGTGHYYFKNIITALALRRFNIAINLIDEFIKGDKEDF